MIGIKVPDKQLNAVKGMLALVPNRMNYGIKLMLNVLAEDVGKAQTALLGSSIDRPTPYTMKAVFVKSATDKDLRALVGLKESSNKNTSTRSGSHYLEPLITGGVRPRKGSESYLVRGSQYYGMASDDYPLDQYGNLPRGKLNQIISQLKAFKEVGYQANRTGVSTIFPVWTRGAHGGLLPGIYERFAMSKAGKIKTGKSAFKRRKGKPALYPRGVRPLMLLSTRPYTYKKQIPWHETAQATVTASADKAAAIAIRYALGRG